MAPLVLTHDNQIPSFQSWQTSMIGGEQQRSTLKKHKHGLSLFRPPALRSLPDGIFRGPKPLLEMSRSPNHREPTWTPRIPIKMSYCNPKLWLVNSLVAIGSLRVPGTFPQSEKGPGLVKTKQPKKPRNESLPPKNSPPHNEGSFSLANPSGHNLGCFPLPF